jgi:phage-related holin
MKIAIIITLCLMLIEYSNNTINNINKHNLDTRDLIIRFVMIIYISTIILLSIIYIK